MIMSKTLIEYIKMKKSWSDEICHGLARYVMDMSWSGKVYQSISVNWPKVIHFRSNWLSALRSWESMFHGVYEFCESEALEVHASPFLTLF